MAGPRTLAWLLAAGLAGAGPSVAHAEPTPLGPLVDVSLGVEVGTRSLTYSDPLTANLRPYDVAAVPLVVPALEVYPLSRTYVPIVRELGLVASYGRALALTSATSGGEPLDTTWDRLLVGARQRVPLGGAGDAKLGVSGVYTMQRFTFAEAPEGLAAELPEVDYRTVRIAVDVALPVGPLRVTALGGYHLVLDTGPVGDRLRDGRAHGMELALGAAWTFTEGFDLRLRATYERTVYAFDPVPGDAYVAGGALDQMLHGGLAVGFTR